MLFITNHALYDLRPYLYYRRILPFIIGAKNSKIMNMRKTMVYLFRSTRFIAAISRRILASHGIRIIPLRLSSSGLTLKTLGTTLGDIFHLRYRLKCSSLYLYIDTTVNPFIAALILILSKIIFYRRIFIIYDVLDHPLLSNKYFRRKMGVAIKFNPLDLFMYLLGKISLRILLGLIDLSVAINEVLCEYLYIMGAKRCRVVYFGVPCSLVDRIRTIIGVKAGEVEAIIEKTKRYASGRKIICWIGSITPYKGIKEILLPLAANTSDLPILYAVIGGGDESFIQDIVSMLHKRGLSNVRLHPSFIDYLVSLRFYRRVCDFGIALIPQYRFKYDQIYFALPSKVFDMLYSCIRPIVCRGPGVENSLVKNFVYTVDCSDIGQASELIGKIIRGREDRLRSKEIFVKEFVCSENMFKRALSSLPRHRTS